MSYEKPICDCTNDLILTIHEMNSMDFRINNNGKAAKSPTKTHKETHDIILGCIECGNLYDVKYDDNNRIVRGKLSREGF